MSTIPMVCICSETKCRNVLVRPFKGNICESCIAKIRARSGPNVNNMSGYWLESVDSVISKPSKLDQDNTRLDAMDVDFPPSVNSHMVGSIYLPSTPHSTSQSSSLDVTQSQRTRISTPIPVTNNKMELSLTPIPSNNNHFNVRGEFIDPIPIDGSHQSINADSPRICQRCRKPLPFDHIRELCQGCHVDLTKVSNNIFSQNERMIHAMFPVSSRHEDIAVVNAEALNHALSVISGERQNALSSALDTEFKGKDHVNVEKSSDPRKRQKLSPSTVIDLTTVNFESMQESYLITNKFFTTKSVKDSPRSLRLCSTENCTGTVSAGSSANRCLSCGREELRYKAARDTLHSFTCWKSEEEERRDMADETNEFLSLSRSVSPQQFLNIEGDTLPEVIAEQSTVDDGDLNDEKLVSKEIGLCSHPAETTLRSDNDNEDHPSDLPGYQQECDQGDFSISRKPRKLSELPVERPSESENRSPHAQDHISGEDIKSVSSLPRNLRRLPEKPILRKTISPFVENGFPTRSLISNDDDSSKNISGWDSDLTNLSTETEDIDSGSSGSEDENDKVFPYNINSNLTISKPSTSTGLKIRIPARPAGMYSRTCGNPKCAQLLAAVYRWKTCVMCRARAREYQRTRQNLQTRHIRLDAEILDPELHNIGTPLSKDLMDRETSSLDVDVSILPGARLCSNRYCTYIIPPVANYHWKMCSLCRIRARERRKEQKNALLSPADSKSPRRRTRKKSSDSNFLLRSLDYLTRNSPSPGSGRCRSVDCGMIVDPSMECNQCAARHRWLMSGSVESQTSEKPVFSRVAPMKQGIKTPRGPPPYHEYKCATSFLQEFKGHLAGFLQAQSIFFLFKSPNHEKALFAFDGEFSIVALDFKIVEGREDVEKRILRLKKDIEYTGRIRFNPQALMSILDVGGIAVRFSGLYPVPVLQSKDEDGKTTIKSRAKHMQCELEIAVLPDHSHRLIPGQRTIVRFRLFG